MTQKKAFAERSRGRRAAWRVLGLAALCLAVWLAGLFWFSTIIPVSVAEPTRETDAIVVLTGGSGRVQKGLELLAAGAAKKLFISGVYQGVDVQQLLRVSQQSPADLECCITLGYQASSTQGNAIETATWMREQGHRTLRLVTSDYHIPRGLHEFRRAMPGIEIVLHPVFRGNAKPGGWQRWTGSASLIVSEYNKYLVALVRGLLGGT